MAEGKLIVNDKGQLRVAFISTKGKATECAARQSEISQQLAERPLEQLHNLEVEFDLESGQPRRIRPKGEPFQPPQLAGIAPHAATSQTQAAGPQRSPTKDKHSPRDTTQTQTFQSQKLTPAFHNPYNFVPAPPRDTQHHELGDHKPAGHHALFPDRYSGTIRVKMKVFTPLLIPDAAKAQKYENDHFSFPVRVDSDGRPYIPPTSVKGMLRAAYEAVTNSRFGVFPGEKASAHNKASGHGARLAYRRPARIDVVPAQIERATNNGITIRILRKLWLRSPAKLPRYDKSGHTPHSRRKGEEKVALRFGDQSLPTQGDHVVVKVSRSGRVMQIRKYDGTVKGDEHEGWVLITEPNISTKTFERVFVVSGSDTLLTLDQAESGRISQLWRELIENYQQLHIKDLEERARKNQKPNDYLGDKPGQTAWSRHIWDKDYVELREGTLCYVRWDGTKITGIYPVTISRELFSKSPLDLLHNSVRPASTLAQLSPADRVFGWVNQNGKGSYKGHVRIGPINCLTPKEQAIDRFGKPGLPLAILGQPKPQQARFYVAASPNGEAQKDGLSKEEAGYAPGKGLRGRKVYPHHTRLPLDYWTNPMEDRTQKSCSGYFQEYRRPVLNNAEQRDNQNRSVQGWVRPNSEFEFDIHVTNLSAVELGALLWLLSLPAEHYHRFGGGKPLGFGSVRLEIDREHTFLYDGNGWKEIYATLDDIELPHANCDQLVESFKKAVKSFYARSSNKNEVSFEQVPFIAAWLRAAKGHETGLPTHYPRARHGNQTGPVPPHPEGLAYEWFVANERMGRPGGPKLSLPNLTNEKGLPIL